MTSFKRPMIELPEAEAHLTRFSADLQRTFNTKGSLGNFPVLRPEIGLTYDVTRLLADDPESLEPDTAQAATQGALQHVVTPLYNRNVQPLESSSVPVPANKMRIHRATTNVDYKPDGSPIAGDARNSSVTMAQNGISGFGFYLAQGGFDQGLFNIRYSFSGGVTNAGHNFRAAAIGLVICSNGIDANGDTELVSLANVLQTITIGQTLSDGLQASGEALFNLTGISDTEALTLCFMNLEVRSPLIVKSPAFAATMTKLSESPLEEPIFIFPRGSAIRSRQ